MWWPPRRRSCEIFALALSFSSWNARHFESHGNLKTGHMAFWLPDQADMDPVRNLCKGMAKNSSGSTTYFFEKCWSRSEIRFHAWFCFFWLGRGKLTIRYVPGRDGGELERLVEHLEAGLLLENQLNDWIPVLWLRLIPHHLATRVPKHYKSCFWFESCHLFQEWISRSVFCQITAKCNCVMGISGHHPNATPHKK